MDGSKSQTDIWKSANLNDERPGRTRGANLTKKDNMERIYTGKEERINGVWYPVTVKASSLKEAIKKLYKGQRKSYGTVEAVRGRFYRAEE